MLLGRLGLPQVRGAEGLLAATLVDSLGSGLLAPFSLLYFHVVVGLGLPVVGLTFSAAAAMGLAAGVAAGSLVDRFGARRALIAAQALQGIGVLSYLLVREPWQLFLAASAAMAGLRLFWPAFLSFVADVAEPGESDRWYGLVAALQSAGIGAGGMAAGVLVQFGGDMGYRVVVAADAVSYLAAACFLVWRASDVRQTVSGPQPRGRGYARVLRDRPYLGFVACNVLLGVCSMMLPVGLPIYVRERLGVPAWVLGSLFTLETVAVVTCQTVAVRALEKVGRARRIALTGFLWCLWALLVALALALPAPLLGPYLLVVTCFYALAVLIHEPTANGLASQTGPPALRGRYVAVFELSWCMVFLIAPAFFTLLFTWRAAAPWLTVAFLALAGGLGTLALEQPLSVSGDRTADV